MKKIKNFSIFLNFVLKKIISLHFRNKSSVFAILFLALKSDKFQKLYRKNNVNAHMNAGRIICITGIIRASTSDSKSAFLVEK